MTICLVDIWNYKTYIHEPFCMKIEKLYSLKINNREPVDMDISDAKAIEKLIQKRKSFKLAMNKKLKYELVRTWRIKLWLTLYGVY